MLRKKKNLEVLKVIYKLKNSIFPGLNYTDINTESRPFSIIKRRCNLWGGWDRNYVSICISGGMNGCGMWSRYLETLSQAMRLIENTWSDSFIENIEFDVTDDIFYATIIIKIRG